MSVRGLILALAFAAPSLPAVAQTPELPVPDNYHPPKKRISPFSAYATALEAYPDAKKPTPRMPDGRPDLNGAWGNFVTAAGIGGLRRPGTYEPDQTVLQRGSGWEKPLYKPELWDKVRALDFSRVEIDPVYTICSIPPGVPRQNVADKIVQTPNEIVFFNLANQRRVRTIPMVSPALTKDDVDFETYDGIPHARWEGDVLIIETVGFTDKTWFQWQGYFHSNQMKVTERLWRKGDLLFYNFTVHDPEVLVEPWTQGTIVRKLAPAPFERMIEPEVCAGVPEFPVGGDLYLRG
jgi:hypothetical protein